MSKFSPLPEPRASWCYFLDVDGTLTDLAATPDHVEIASHVINTLERLIAATGGAVALVSGRPLTDIDRLFAPLRLPGAGQHGMEVRDLNGTISKPSELPLGYDVICERLSEYVSGIRGALLEDKGYSVALHYRQAPDQGLPARAVAEAAVAPFADDYQVLTGNMVLEIKPRGIDKGTAIVDLMKRIHWSQRPPTFAGDDTTDEDGFAVVNKLNGVSIRVGQTDNTCAKYQVASVDELLEWLNRISSAP